MRHEPKKEPGSQAPDKKFICHKFHGGCGSEVLFEGYNRSAMLCGNCARKVAAMFGFEVACANYAVQEINIPWYERKFPGFQTLGRRAQCRMLALAAGCDGVLQVTDQEQRGAEKIRAGMHEGFYVAVKSEPVADRIMAEMEKQTWMEVWR